MGTTTKSKARSGRREWERERAEAYERGKLKHRLIGAFYAHADATPNPARTLEHIVAGLERLERDGDLNPAGLRRLARQPRAVVAKRAAAHASSEAAERRRCERAIVAAAMERRGGTALAQEIHWVTRKLERAGKARSRA